MRSRLWFVVAMFVLAACGDNKGSHDAGPTSDAHVDAFAPIDAASDVTCATLAPIGSGATCSVQGVGTTKLIEGTVLTPTTVFHGGQVGSIRPGRSRARGATARSAARP